MFKYALIALATSVSLATPAMAKDFNSNPNPVIIADTVMAAFSLAPQQSIAAGMQNSNQITISKSGAEFIKVHFSYFNLPQGAYVTVSDPQGNENYRYDGANNNTATYNSAVGENGLTQFSAMSVFGDTANVKLVVPAGVVWQKQHGIKIDRYNAGTTEEVSGPTTADSILAEGVSNLMIDSNGSVPTPSSTCGVNERRDVACWASSHPDEYDRTRPVARLLMGGSGLCTGWRVGNDNHMFTNNHCVDNQASLADTEVWFNYQRSSCGGSSNVTTVKVTGKDLLKTDYNLDYTLFSVNNFANIASFGNYGLETRAPSKGEHIYIAQHGSGNPKELAIESDQNADGLCQIDVASATGRAAGTDTGYFCDTIGGSSGSPVLASSSHKAIALHHFGGCENQGVRMDKIWPQVSSFFGGVAPIGDGPGTGGNQPPVAQMTQSCNNLSCSFDGSGSVDSDGSITTYAWDFSDGTGNGVTAQHIFSNAGSYNVTLTVTDDKGAQGSTTQQVSVSDGNTSNELSSGVPVGNLSGAKDAEDVYFINTTENNTEVTVAMSGGTGDADLYVKKGAIPTKTDYDCRPYVGGNNENCNVTVGTPGKVYAKLIGYSAYSGVSVVATNTVASSNGFPKTNVAATKDNWEHFTYTVPAGVSQINVTTSGGSGDADLYVRNGAQPTASTYDCRPFKAGNTESCTAAVTAGDVVHISLKAYSTFSGVTLNVQ